MTVLNNTYFNIKTFTVIPYPEFKKGNYKKMVDGLWYKYLNQDGKEEGELDIVVNFKLDFEINEEDVTSHTTKLNKALAQLSGEKNSISNLIPRLKEKGKLLRELLDKYEQQLEEQILIQEKSRILNEIERLKEEHGKVVEKHAEVKVDLKDVNERINLLYKDLKDNIDNEEFEVKLEQLKQRQVNLLKSENQCKIDIEVLKEDITYYSKNLRKPLTNIELEKKIRQQEGYKRVKKQIIAVANVLEYVERLDKSQDEKSLVLRAIKSVWQSDHNSEKRTIDFS